MEDIHKIIYGYNNPEEFKFIMSLDDRFYDKVEKMKVVVESEDDETLVFGESSEKLFNIIYG
jgi:hypothetical protein